MIVSAVVLLGRAVAAPAARRARSLAAAAAERHFPGRLRVISARPLFPAGGGAEVLLAIVGDPDAFVRLRIDRTAPSAERLAEALAEATGAAERWRELRQALASRGYAVHALGRVAAEPWIAAELTNDTVADVMAGLRDLPPGTSVLVADPAVVRRLPADRDPSLPTLLRLTSRRRLAVLSGAGPYHRASFGADDGESALSLLRPFTLQQAYEAAVAASALRWLGRHVPGAEVAAVTGASRLLPGRVDRLRVHLVVRDGPGAPADHVLAVTTDLAGTLTGEPPVLTRDVRDGSGLLRPPPL